jgi:ectoine hydroxylase-related dioxygenase (phytanoyl-CoA dioxygenase family)
MNETVYKSALPGVPRIESPAFRAELPHFGLSEAEQVIATKLHVDGFAVIDFEDVEFDQRVDRIHASLIPRLGAHLNDPGSDKTQGLRRIQDAWQFDDDVRAIAANPAILNLLSRLYGRRAFPFQTLNFPVGTQQAVHADAVHFSSLPERFMCGVWVAMEDVPAEAGPLFYAPGSHRWPIVSNSMIGRRGYASQLESAQEPYADAWNAMIAANDTPTETFLARKGQALIWCANLLHGGAPQTDPRLTRWSQVTHYYFEDCIYYTPAFSDETLGQLQLRDIVGIDDGKLRPNSYLGVPLPSPAQRKRSRVGRLLRKLAPRRGGN